MASCGAGCIHSQEVKIEVFVKKKTGSFVDI